VPRILRSRRVISRKFLLATCSLSVPIFLFTAILFVLFPRVGLSLLLLGHSRSTRMIGFSDHVDLGGVGKLRTDPTIAMRVVPARLPENPPVRLALYLRGTAFDHYDGRPGRELGRSDTRRIKSGRSFSFGLTSGPTRTKPSRSISSLFRRPWFSCLRRAGVQVLQRGEPVLGRPTPVFVGPESEYKYAGDERGLRYESAVEGRGGRDPRSARFVRSRAIPHVAAPTAGRVVQLREDMDAPCAHSARDGSGGGAPPAHRIPVTTSSRPRAPRKNPLDHFLFESHAAHCEFYSTAMAVLLRSVGVPTRNVTGFVGGTYNRFGRFYAVRQGDAHSWVEVYLDGRGLGSLRPTPPASAVPQVETAGVVALIRDMIEAAASAGAATSWATISSSSFRLLRWAATHYAKARREVASAPTRRSD